LYPFGVSRRIASKRPQGGFVLQRSGVYKPRPLALQERQKPYEISGLKRFFCGLKGRRITAQGKGACAVALGYGIKTYSRPARARPYGTVV